MIEELRPYPEMKPSGVPWLGDVPAHWEVRRLGTVSSLLVSNVDKVAADDEHPVRLCNYVDVYRNDVIRADLPFMRATASSAEIDKFRLRVSDVVITKDSEDWRDIGVPAYVADAPDDLVCGYHLAILRPSTTSSGQFLYWALRNEGSRYQLSIEANGITRYGLSQSAIKSVLVPVPPLEEQQLVGRFLSHAIRLIGCYIRAKGSLIKRVEEQKQAIIHRVLTHGLDPNGPTDVTQNYWFPEIPSGWTLAPMRRLIHRAVDGPHHSPKYLDEGIPFLSARNLKPDRWSLDDVKFITVDDYKVFSRRVKPVVGDVLYTKGGTTGVARVVDFDFPFQVWVHVAVLKLDETRTVPEYLALALNSPRCYEQSQLFTRGATNQDLGLGRMKDIVLPVPSIETQNAVVDHVRSATSRLSEAGSTARREIDLAQELRTRLIADVVTGKLDVREAAARLPVETGGEDAEMFDPADDVDAEAPDDEAMEEAAA